MEHDIDTSNKVGKLSCDINLNGPKIEFRKVETVKEKNEEIETLKQELKEYIDVNVELLKSLDTVNEEIKICNGKFTGVESQIQNYKKYIKNHVYDMNNELFLDNTLLKY
jgi:chromosome segregation ATPase